MSESKANLSARCDDLLNRLQVVGLQLDQATLEIIRLKQILLMPTDEMLDAVRPIISYSRSQITYGDMRKHVQACGHNLNDWPAWARDAMDDVHINKASMASLIWSVMASKAVEL